MKDEELKTEAEKTNEENEDHGGRTVGTDDERGELRSFLQWLIILYTYILLCGCQKQYMQ